MIENSREFAERETGIAPSCPPDKLQPVKATMPKPETVTRQGKPVSVLTRSSDIAKEHALKTALKKKRRRETDILAAL